MATMIVSSHFAKTKIFCALLSAGIVRLWSARILRAVFGILPNTSDARQDADRCRLGSGRSPAQGRRQFLAAFILRVFRRGLKKPHRKYCRAASQGNSNSVF